jgi:hypothetical protein
MATELKDSTRVSVGLTRPELDELTELARRCNTSVSALGQLAIKHLLIQARAGALPMLPPASVMETTTPTSSLERAEAGMMVSYGHWREEFYDLKSKVDHYDAVNELDRLFTLTSPEE